MSENPPSTFGCDTNFEDIQDYHSLNSMVTHIEHFSAKQDLELVINSLILHQCLVAMEYLERDDNGVSIACLLYQYQAAVRLVHII